MNSFKAVYLAMEYEADRQRQVIAEQEAHPGDAGLGGRQRPDGLTTQ
jgi:Asp-tRNA(Asn)/Glu-tRNA(Gln) amidotransferase B subunit